VARQRTVEMKVRDSWILQLRRTGMSFDDIAQAVARKQAEEAAQTGDPIRGFTSQAARNAFKKALAESYREDNGEAVELELERLDELVRQATRLLYGTYYKVSTSGRVVAGPDGTPLRDPDPVLAAIRELRGLSESRRKLIGLDAPTRQRVEIISEDMIDQEIIRLEAKLGVSAAGAGQMRRAIEAAPTPGPAQT
jgi:hypothetical protein